MNETMKCFLVFVLLVVTGAVFEESGYKSMAMTFSSLASIWVVLILFCGWEPFRKDS